MNLGKKSIQQKFKPQVLTEQVSQVLMDMILDGTLEPGDRLLENELKEHLGVSRSPLREAFRDLEKKGLVNIIPRKGAYVREITRKDIEENFPIRSVLEGLAAREAYPRLNKTHIAEMGEALEAMKKACQAEDTAGYRKSHGQFHEVFIQACGNQLLIDMLENLRMHRLWYLVSYRYQRLDFQKAIDVHARILKLFSSPNADLKKLEEAVGGHIDEALEPLFGLDEKDPGHHG